MFGMMQETKKLPIHVKIWMGIMVLTFASHGFFLDSTRHLVSFATFFVTLAIFAPLSFARTQNVSAIAASHFIAWPIVLAGGVQYYLSAGIPASFAVADAVLAAGYAVFCISLILDYRIVLGELHLAAQSFKSTKGPSL